MFKKNANAHGGFTPAVSALPNCDTTDQVIRHHRKMCTGGEGGQALSPPSKYACFFF